MRSDWSWWLRKFTTRPIADAIVNSRCSGKMFQAQHDQQHERQDQVEPDQLGAQCAPVRVQPRHHVGVVLDVVELGFGGAARMGRKDVAQLAAAPAATTLAATTAAAATAAHQTVGPHGRRH